jgi:hypothetical protein
MEVFVIGALFFGMVVGGAILAVTLVVKALRADQHYVNDFEGPAHTVTSAPAWVKGQSAAV